MDRLTERKYGELVSVKNEETGMSCSSFCNKCSQGSGNCKYVKEMVEKLAVYEDLEEQGLLLRLPCKVGDTVYRICPKCNDNHNGSCENCAWRFSAKNVGCDIYGLWKDGQYRPDKCTIVSYKVTWNYIPNLLEHMNKTVFLTHEEAEAALKKMKEDSEE